MPSVSEYLTLTEIFLEIYVSFINIRQVMQLGVLFLFVCFWSHLINRGILKITT